MNTVEELIRSVATHTFVAKLDAPSDFQIKLIGEVALTESDFVFG